MNADRVSGVVLFLFALAVAWEASKLPFGTINAPDTGFFPLLLAVTLALVSGLVVLSTWIPTTGATAMPTWQGAGRVVVAVATLAAYVAVINSLGYLLATALVMLILLRSVERLGWRVSLAFTVVSVVASYLLFRRLGVPLPPGVVSF
jgi:putative tricarboxylic transport membrane protein